MPDIPTLVRMFRVTEDRQLVEFLFSFTDDLDDLVQQLENPGEKTCMGHLASVSYGRGQVRLPGNGIRLRLPPVTLTTRTQPDPQFIHCGTGVRLQFDPRSTLHHYRLLTCIVITQFGHGCRLDRFNPRYRFCDVRLAFNYKRCTPKTTSYPQHGDVLIGLVMHVSHVGPTGLQAAVDWPVGDATVTIKNSTQTAIYDYGLNTPEVDPSYYTHSAYCLEYGHIH
jgi:hypothetical protein